MYIICSRCQFKVPATKSICHICGNAKLKVDDCSTSLQPTFRALDNLVATSSAMRGDVAQLTANMSKACDQARHSAQHAVKILRHLFTSNGSAKQNSTDKQQVDYLAAYKASIEDDLSSKYTAATLSPRVEKPKRKVELLDEMSVTRLHIDELVNWFEEFGKDGILVPAQKEIEDTQLSDAA